jgi:hypothetical protein
MNRDPRLRNKWWRLTHLYKILSKRGELVVFKPNVVQLMILMSLGRRLRARILKYRQGGVTTLFCILYLDDALWTPGFSAAIIAHDRSTLDKIFMIVKRAYDNLPDSIKPYTRQDTLRSYRFEKTYDGQPLDSSIYVDMKIRGTTVQALHISERAYIEGDKSRELEAGSKQAVPSFGRITEESTANGFNEYYDAFTDEETDSLTPQLEYLNLFYAWHEDPQYRLPGAPFERTEEDNKLDKQVFDAYGYHLDDEQIRWYNWKEKELVKAARESDDKVGLTGRQLMKQEYPSTMLEAFQSGQGNVFDSAILQTYTPAPFKEIIDSKEVPGQKIKVIHSPEPGKFYGLGCDPSDGSGDPAGIAIWDENYRKVAEWHGLLRPDNLAKLVKEMAEMYNTAFAGVENNMLSTILFLSKIYNNYYSTVTVDERRQRRTKKMGWTTTGKSRDVMIDEFIMHFEEETLRDLTAQSLKEMQTFVITEGGKREHAVGKHDDMLFADFIACQMVKMKKQSKTQERVYAEKPAGF